VAPFSAENDHVKLERHNLVGIALAAAIPAQPD